METRKLILLGCSNEIIFFTFLLTIDKAAFKVCFCFVFQHCMKILENSMVGLIKIFKALNFGEFYITYNINYKYFDTDFLQCTFRIIMIFCNTFGSIPLRLLTKNYNLYGALSYKRTFMKSLK